MPIKRIRKFIYKNERYLSFIAFIGGFIIDNLTLTRIDLWLNNLILFAYLISSGVGIMLVQSNKDKIFKCLSLNKARPFLDLVIQFSFGGLFSGYFIYFLRSASLSSSWFFIFILLFLMLSNEFFKEYYKKLVFQVNVFYFAVFSFSIFYIPVILGKMGAFIFILSGLVSLVCILLFLYLFYLIIPKEIKEKKKVFTISILGIFIFINVLYFTNVIPPVPLALKDVGVYNFVGKTIAGGYVVRFESKKWYEFGIGVEKIHINPGSPVYVYSAVFAPVNLDTNIFHKWQYYDTDKKEWVTLSKIQIPIIGGRGGGYRGYSFKENVFPGQWRVDIVTGRGQTLGRVFFDIVYFKKPVILNTEFK